MGKIMDKKSCKVAGGIPWCFETSGFHQEEIYSDIVEQPRSTLKKLETTHCNVWNENQIHLLISSKNPKF